eukprot:TRINITY_DN494_c0_g2_i1.p1 TRINITY_DN494_c0_g2~~TRINITY_DN494_c0_g2_i1.p1  ORF type:complete len:267 (-),score=44.13 TRINITY_DN494_c0_g2_i1:277-1077(-)
MWHTWALLESQQENNELITRSLFQKALSLAKRSRYILLSYGLWELQRGDVDKARQIFRQGCESNPADVPLMQAYGLLEARFGESETARSLFEKASQIDPNHIPVLQAWALLESGQGRLEESRKLLKIAIERATKNVDQVFCFQAWGCIEEKLQNYATARDLFKCALRIDTQNEPSWVAWIQMEERLGLMNRAQEVRLLRTQQKVDIQQGTNFTTRPQPSINPVLNTISNWFNPLGKGDGGYGDKQAEDDILKQIMSLEEDNKSELD